MGSFKISSTIFCFILLAMFWPCRAQNPQQDYLDVHNAARAQVNVGPLAWDDRLAAYAQNYSRQRMNDCQLVHSGGPYGENLAAGSGDFSARAAVNLWVNEKQYYDYKSNSCTQGKECLHDTQVVWRKSVRMGCARV